MTVPMGNLSFHCGKKHLTKGLLWCLIGIIFQTVEAENGLHSASTESPRWWKWGEIAGQFWAAEGRGNGLSQYL